MVKKKRSSRKFDASTFVWIFVLSLGALALFFSQRSLTGYVVVSGGSTVSAGSQTVSDPQYGATKGTLDFTLTDGGVVIGTSIGNNYTLYFTRFSISNLSLLKVSSTNSAFSGTLSNVDGDGSSSRCSSSTYLTTKEYYDENNDGVEQGNEPDVYAITTDANGCFAIKVKVGLNNVYG